MLFAAFVVLLSQHFTFILISGHFIALIFWVPYSLVVSLTLIHSPARHRCGDFYRLYAYFMYIRNGSVMFNAICTHDAMSAYARILHSALPRRRYCKYTASKKAVSVASIVLSLLVIIINTSSLKSHHLMWRSFFSEKVTIECFRSPSAVNMKMLTPGDFWWRHQVKST